MNTESDTAETWNLYGAHQIARKLQLPELDRWDWGIPGTGPGTTPLGEVTGLRVLDLGSGLGRHAAHLAALGADVTAVDASPTQHQRALARYPHTPGLRLVCADAVAHLRDANPYDLIYSVGSMPYLDPDRLLPALANGLKPGGRLVFSALYTNSNGTGPSADVAPRPEILRLPGTTEDHPVNMWVLTPRLWKDLLAQHGLTMEAVTAINSPKPDNAVSYRLYAARRPLNHKTYLQALQSVAAADEADLLAAVLRDEDTSMAVSAVSRHLDRRATELITDPAFTAWAQAMSRVIDQHDFLTTRLHEWRLLRTLALREPWAAEELTDASDWLQRTAVTTQIVTAPDVLRLLAERGRTRRVRNAAHHRLHHLKKPG